MIWWSKVMSNTGWVSIRHGTAWLRVAVVRSSVAETPSHECGPSSIPGPCNQRRLKLTNRGGCQGSGVVKNVSISISGQECLCEFAHKTFCLAEFDQSENPYAFLDILIPVLTLYFNKFRRYNISCSLNGESFHALTVSSYFSKREQIEIVSHFGMLQCEQVSIPIPVFSLILNALAIVSLIKHIMCSFSNGNS